MKSRAWCAYHINRRRQSRIEEREKERGQENNITRMTNKCYYNIIILFDNRVNVIFYR